MSPNWSDAVALLGVLLLVAMNGYFVAAEFALVTVRWTRVEELFARGGFGAAAVRHAIEHLDDAIAACQLGITFASLALGWVGEPMLAHRLEPLFRAMPLPWSVAVAHGTAIAVAYLLLTYLHVVLGEQAPKALAIRRAEDVALFVTGPLLAFSRAFRPFIVAIGGSSNLLVRMLRLKPLPASKAVHSVEELSMLVEETEEAGVIPKDQASYVRNVIELSDKTVRDVMVPRERVVTLSLHASEEQVLAVARETAHTRMPVWDEHPDKIVGIVNTKDLFHLFSLRGVVILMDAMYPALFLKPEQPVARVLGLFRREKRQMAVVKDAEDRFLGIVTLEDILEEIVGEIEDEHDVSPLSPLRAEFDTPGRQRPPAPAPLADARPAPPELRPAQPVDARPKPADAQPAPPVAPRR